MVPKETLFLLLEDMTVLTTLTNSIALILRAWDAFRETLSRLRFEFSITSQQSVLPLKNKKKFLSFLFYVCLKIIVFLQ